MSTTTPKQKFTAADYEALPEGDKRQLIAGELIDMSPEAIVKHAQISLSLASALVRFVRERALGTVLLPVNVYLDPESYVAPDLCFISNARASRILEKRIDGAPDLVIEILSPSNRRYDLRGKRDAYARAGVVEAWYLDPEIDEVSLFRFAEDPKKPVRIFVRGETLRSTIFPDFQPSVDAIFDATL